MRAQQSTPSVVDHPGYRLLAAGASSPLGKVSRALSLHVSERRLLLAGVDVLAVNLALALTRTRDIAPGVWASLLTYPEWYVSVTLTWFAAAFLLDGYNLRRAARLDSALVTALGAAALTALVYLAIPRVTPPLPGNRLPLFEFAGAMLALVAGWRGIYALFLTRTFLPRPVLIVGAGWAGQAMVAAIREHGPGGYAVVGFVDDDPGKRGEVIGRVPVLGTRHDLVRLIREAGISEVIVAITESQRIHVELFDAIMACHERGVRVMEMPQVYEELTGKVPVEHAGRNLHVILPLEMDPKRLQETAKRVFDLILGLIGLVILAVLTPLVWLGHLLESRGSVFYTQWRVGRGGHPFRLVKFRTMVADAEAEGPRWAAEADRRVTRVGWLLRRLHLDEIPQALNLLRGELSFVGPRPERPEFVAELERQIPFYRARHAVKPGITGWAQVNFRYAASVEDALIKLQYDLYYIKHKSIWLDLRILFKTLGHVLTLRGR